MTTSIAADEAISMLGQLGIAGGVLAVFVVPVYLALVKGVQKRLDDTAKHEEEDWKSRAEREALLTQRLIELSDVSSRAQQQIAVALTDMARAQIETSRLVAQAASVLERIVTK